MSESVINGVFEVSDPLEAADGDLMLFDIVPDRLDARLATSTTPHVGRHADAIKAYQCGLARSRIRLSRNVAKVVCATCQLTSFFLSPAAAARTSSHPTTAAVTATALIPVARTSSMFS